MPGLGTRQVKISLRTPYKLRPPISQIILTEYRVRRSLTWEVLIALKPQHCPGVYRVHQSS